MREDSHLFFVISIYVLQSKKQTELLILIYLFIQKTMETGLPNI